MASDATDLIAIDALGPDGAYRTRNREPVMTTDGVAVAELSMAPSLYVTRAISAQRGVRPLPARERDAALGKAADAFANGVIAGLDFDAYIVAASRISGVPISVTRAGARSVADGVASAFGAVHAARPSGAVLDWRDGRAGGAVWAR
ncbi:MAG: aldehyde dehydrogenase, partial [Mycobacterium sp.]